MKLLAPVLLMGGVLAGGTAPDPSTATASAAEDAADPAPATTGNPVPRSITLIDGKPATPKEAPFSHGEVLTFSATFMGMNVGEATMTVDTNSSFAGKPAIHLVQSARSNTKFSLFYSIKDAGESWIDPVGLYSLGFVSDQNETNIVDYQKWTIDNDRGVASRDRIRRKDNGPVKKSNTDYPMTATHVQDAASMAYYFRAFDLKLGQKLESDVFVSKKVWKLTVDIVAKETVKVPAGTFECLKVKPSVTLNGQVQQKGSMTTWVTDDDRKMPVKIVSETPFGKVTAVLKKFKEGAED